LHYTEANKENWKSITQKLVEEHPLSLDEILEISNLSWERLWSSNIGGEIKLTEVELPATVIGYFFQKLFALELSNRYPDEWRGEIHKDDKDLVHKKVPIFSTEMKASGQVGLKIFGNRSYNQETQEGTAAGKGKSGYYITLNYVDQTITLLRLGWIDQSDWKPQGAATGQAATLADYTYTDKLIEIQGEYRKHTPIQLLNGIGKDPSKGKGKQLHDLGIFTLEELIAYAGNNKTVESVKKGNSDLISKVTPFLS